MMKSTIIRLAVLLCRIGQSYSDLTSTVDVAASTSSTATSSTATAASTSISLNLLSSLPTCAQSCASNAIPSSCSTLDLPCLCQSASFVDDTFCCAENACDATDTRSAIQDLDSYCSAAGVAITITALCSASGVASSGTLTSVNTIKISVSQLSLTSSTIKTTTSTLSTISPSAEVSTSNLATSTVTSSETSTGSTATPTAQSSDGQTFSSFTNSNNSLAKGAIGGIVAAVIIAILILIFVIFYFRRRLQRKKLDVPIILEPSHDLDGLEIDNARVEDKATRGKHELDSIAPQIHEIDSQRKEKSPRSSILSPASPITGLAELDVVSTTTVSSPPLSELPAYEKAPRMHRPLRQHTQFSPSDPALRSRSSTPLPEDADILNTSNIATESSMTGVSLASKSTFLPPWVPGKFQEDPEDRGLDLSAMEAEARRLSAEIKEGERLQKLREEKMELDRRIAEAKAKTKDVDD